MLPTCIKNNIKKILYSTCGHMAKPYAGLGACLTYHAIVSNNMDVNGFSPNLSLMVRADRFEEQVRFLSSNYNCMSLDEAVARLMRDELPPRTVLLTFDDGYQDNLELALPILEKYSVPAAIFVATGFMNRAAVPWWHELEFLLQGAVRVEFQLGKWRQLRHLRSDEERLKLYHEINGLLMSLPPDSQEQLLQSLRQSQPERIWSGAKQFLDWSEVKKLDSHPLITIGCHTRRHVVLNALTQSDLQKEISDSKVELENTLAHKVHHFCYPFGSSKQVGKREFAAVSAAGFVCAFTTRCGHIQAAHKKFLTALPRIDMGYHDSLVSLKWKLSGLESFCRNPGKRLVVE